MDFEANGGGDTPESVNQALYDAVHNMSWSQGEQAYQVIFLVGDAPPHMDYNEVRYPEIVASALEKGIVINTIQCGDIPSTIQPWTQIASLGHGSFFQVEQAGGAVAFTTPYDEEIAKLSARLDDTRLYYGTEEEKNRMHMKVAAADKLEAYASVANSSMPSQAAKLNSTNWNQKPCPKCCSRWRRKNNALTLGTLPTNALNCSGRSRSYRQTATIFLQRKSMRPVA
jgi:hypothetical protein